LLIVEAPPTADLFTIFCWVQDDDFPFLVDIDSNKTIGHLKESILAKKPNLSITDASTLQLCVADIPDTDTDREQFSFEDRKVLPGSDELSYVFKDGPPKKRHIHIAIKKPNGKGLKRPAEEGKNLSMTINFANLTLSRAWTGHYEAI
jgi:hypothetical protein